MGYSEKAQVVEGGFESENNSRKWVIPGIALRAPLKPIQTNSIEKEQQKEEEVEIEECSTPTNEESKIPTSFTCPPAPRKQKSSLKRNYHSSGVIREFFKAPDLENVFIRHVESAN